MTDFIFTSVIDFNSIVSRKVIDSIYVNSEAPSDLGVQPRQTAFIKMIQVIPPLTPIKQPSLTPKPSLASVGISSSLVRKNDDLQ